MKKGNRDSFDEERLRALREKKRRALEDARKPPPSLEGREEDFYREMLKAAVEKALGVLSEDDRELIRVYYRPDASDAAITLTELARRRRCKRTALYRRLTLALLELRQAMLHGS